MHRGVRGVAERRVDDDLGLGVLEPDQLVDHVVQHVLGQVLEHVHAQDDVVIGIGRRGLDVRLPDLQCDATPLRAKLRERKAGRIEIGERDIEAALPAVSLFSIGAALEDPMSVASDPQQKGSISAERLCARALDLSLNDPASGGQIWSYPILPALLSAESH